MKTVAYIHGLNSSSRSFGYILKDLPEHNVICIDYSSHQALAKSISQVLRQLPKDEKLSLVGHSLGGLIAALIAAGDQERIESLVTISSPLGGSKAAGVMRWLPGRPEVLSDIAPSSAFISLLKNSNLSVPTLSIFSTGGHLKMMPEPNDSIVTVSSQKSLSFGKKFEVKANHFEVLMHPKTVEAVSNHVFGEPS